MVSRLDRNQVKAAVCMAGGDLDTDFSLMVCEVGLMKAPAFELVRPSFKLMIRSLPHESSKLPIGVFILLFANVKSRVLESPNLYSKLSFLVISPNYRFRTGDKKGF